MYDYFKSIIDQDSAPIVICDLDSVIVYMNPASVKAYRADLTGRKLALCHSSESNEKIRRVLAWFQTSPEHNCVFTSRGDRENKDIYMVALRNGQGQLIGYYEKHAYRDPETALPYTMD